MAYRYQTQHLKNIALNYMLEHRHKIVTQPFFLELPEVLQQEILRHGTSSPFPPYNLHQASIPSKFTILLQLRVLSIADSRVLTCIGVHPRWPDPLKLLLETLRAIGLLEEAKHIW